MSLLLRSLPALSVLGVLSLGCAIDVAQAEGDSSIALILDASGSMNARLPDGTSRMDAAKSAVEELVNSLAADTRLAFRAYGHQSPRQSKNCKDTAPLAPFDAVANNKAAIVETAKALQPQGYTPITLSLTL